MKAMLKGLALAVLLFNATGCVSVMKREAFQAPLHQSEEAINSMQADLAMRESTYNAVMQKTSTPKAPPYPALGELLKQMRAAYAKVSVRKPRIVALQKEYEDLSQGRPDISSDRPQWTPFMKIYDEAKALLPKMTEESAAYTVPANQFSALFNSAGLVHFKTAEIKGQLAASLTALDKAVIDIRNQMNTMKEKLNERSFLTLGLDKQKERRAILDHIGSLTEQLDKSAGALKAKVGSFEASIAGQDEVWQGPGLPKVDIIDQVKKDMDQINGLSSQINGEANKWNEMNK